MDTKGLFQVVKSLASLSNKSHIALDFKWQHDAERQVSIQDHLKELFYRADVGHLDDSMVADFDNGGYTEITEADTLDAIRSTGNKATGIDALPIKRLKDLTYRKKLAKHCTVAFNEWLRKGSVPTYCKEARVIPLSKEEKEFPSVGAIRTVCVLPGVFKVYEKIVLSKLKPELKAKSPLHEC